MCRIKYPLECTNNTFEVRCSNWQTRIILRKLASWALWWSVRVGLPMLVGGKRYSVITLSREGPVNVAREFSVIENYVIDEVLPIANCQIRNSHTGEDFQNFDCVRT